MSQGELNEQVLSGNSTIQNSPVAHHTKDNVCYMTVVMSREASRICHYFLITHPFTTPLQSSPSRYTEMHVAPQSSCLCTYLPFFLKCLLIWLNSPLFTRDSMPLSAFVILLWYSLSHLNFFIIKIRSHVFVPHPILHLIHVICVFLPASHLSISSFMSCAYCRLISTCMK